MSKQLIQIYLESLHLNSVYIYVPVGVLVIFKNLIIRTCVARPALSHQAQPSIAQPRYKSVSASLSSPSVPLQSQSQGGTLLLGGSCNILSSGAVLSVEGFSGRAAQQSDRSCNSTLWVYFSD